MKDNKQKRLRRPRWHGGSEAGKLNDLALLPVIVVAGAVFSWVVIQLLGPPAISTVTSEATSDDVVEAPAETVAPAVSPPDTQPIVPVEPDADLPTTTVSPTESVQSESAQQTVGLPADPVPNATDSDAGVVVVPAEPERIGGMGDPDQRTSDLAQAPEEVIHDCEKHFNLELSDNMRLRAHDGPAACSFSVEFEGLVNRWSLMTVPRLPSDVLDILVIDPKPGNEFKLEVNGGEILDVDDHSWRWQAPEKPGIYCVRIVEKYADEAMCIHAAVVKDWDGESDEINGYKIGQYQDKPLHGNPRYNKPRGFIEVTEENQDTWVSPHFQLKQFVCKQQGGFPKYMLLEPRLLLKLEILIERLEKSGIDTDSLYILSGFRTPWYNKAIGNTTSYSRHLYGDAADLFVDVNRDGKMDDLDFDGAVDGDDARVLHQTIQEITAEKEHLQGGLGFYDNVNYRNPFVHVDTRGTPARWYK